MAARGPDPLPAFRFCLLWAAYVAILTEGAVAVIDFEVPECEGLLDYLTGCDNGYSQFIAIFVLGIIPGAPAQINAIFALVGVIVRATAIWAFIRLLRGV